MKYNKQDRITPACAGNRGQQAFRVIAGEDHPRVCGEQASSSLQRTTNPGSPPRVRGTGIFLQSLLRRDRITPACAGNRFRLGFSAI